MKPNNEAAMIVEACQELDVLLRRKYMIIGGATVTIILLFIAAVVSVFTNENWFLLLLSIPLIVWFGTEKYIEALNSKMVSLTNLIRCNHENQMRRKQQNYNQQQSEV